MNTTQNNWRSQLNLIIILLILVAGFSISSVGLGHYFTSQIAAAASHALAPPVLPATFFGTVELIGGEIAPGTEITAWINGVPYATASTRANGTSITYQVDVPGDDPTTAAIEGGRDGNTVDFRIIGLTTPTTGTWQEGSLTELNLRFELALSTTPTMTTNPPLTGTPTVTPTPLATNTPTATPEPAVNLSVSAVPSLQSSISPGDSIEYTIGVVNSGGRPLNNLTLQADLSTHVTYVSNSADPVPAISPIGLTEGRGVGGLLSWQVDSLDIGARFQASFSVLVEKPSDAALVELSITVIESQSSIEIQSQVASHALVPQALDVVEEPFERFDTIEQVFFPIVR
ncbi:MAG: hypothetical protein AAF702_39970 [Chloroflexota bacterium]